MEACIRSIFSAARLLWIWDRLRASFWFLPSLMAAGAILLSFELIRLDTAIEFNRVVWIYGFGPSGARAILSAIASSMITVAGLTFSVTMLTIQLATSQFGPRLLRNFMRDRGNQVVLGTFISTFIYCLLVLRSVRGQEDASFVPHISVAVGVLLAIASLAVLIYFIHHTAYSVRIETLLARLTAEARAAIDQFYPERLGRNAPGSPGVEPDQANPPVFDDRSRSICASRSGYAQVVDDQSLIVLAKRRDLIVRIEARPGRFVTERDPVLTAFPRDRVPDEVADALRDIVIVGDERTPQQDIEFSIRRIVEIAQRALSPGINDPTTALYCIDRLGEIFGRIAERDLPAPRRYDDEGCLRVLTEVAGLGDLACPAFAAIARYGGPDADVIGRLLAVLFSLSEKVEGDESERLAKLSEAIRRESQGRMSLSFDARSIATGGEQRTPDGCDRSAG